MHNIILHALSQLSNTLLEGYKDAQSEFSVLADPATVQQTIASYRELVNRNQVTGNERNIDWWRKQGWELFNNFVAVRSNSKSKRQEKQTNTRGKSITLGETNDWLIVIPLDKDASCYHGRHTDWCTTKPFANYFEEYFYDKSVVLVYFLQINTGSKWAIACHTKENTIECFDQQDNSISANTFESQTGFDPVHYRQLALDAKHIPSYDKARNQYQADIAYINSAIPTLTDRSEQLEQVLWRVKSIRLMINYCIKVNWRWPQAEKVILSGVGLATNDPLYACKYASALIQGRWPEFEQQLTKVLTKEVTDPALDQAITYINQVANTNVKQFEDAIADNKANPFALVEYKSHIDSDGNFDYVRYSMYLGNLVRQYEAGKFKNTFIEKSTITNLYSEIDQTQAIVPVEVFRTDNAIVAMKTGEHSTFVITPMQPLHDGEQYTVVCQSSTTVETGKEVDFGKVLERFEPNAPELFDQMSTHDSTIHDNISDLDSIKYLVYEHEYFNDLPASLRKFIRTATPEVQAILVNYRTKFIRYIDHPTLQTQNYLLSINNHAILDNWKADAKLDPSIVATQEIKSYNKIRDDLLQKASAEAVKEFLDQLKVNKTTGITDYVDKFKQANPTAKYDNSKVAELLNNLA